MREPHDRDVDSTRNMIRETRKILEQFSESADDSNRSIRRARELVAESRKILKRAGRTARVLP
jgi:hypothetical protein